MSDLKQEIDDFFREAGDSIAESAVQTAKDAVLGGGCKIQLVDIARWVGIQVARIQALFISKVYQYVYDLLAKLQLEVCPPWEEVERLLKIRDNIVKLIIHIQSRLNKILAFANKLQTPIRIAQVLIKILKVLPVPNAFTTVGVTNVSSDTLSTACRFLEQLKNEIKTIEKIVASLVAALANLEDLLNRVDIELGRCIAEENDIRLETGIGDPIVLSALPFPFNSAMGNLTGPQFYNGANGRRYKLEVINDPDSPAIAQRRQAVARDSEGVIVLRGPKSFSSSENVLIEELKFRIDNQLS